MCSVDTQRFSAFVFGVSTFLSLHFVSVTCFALIGHRTKQLRICIFLVFFLLKSLLGFTTFTHHF